MKQELGPKGFMRVYCCKVLMYHSKLNIAKPTYHLRDWKFLYKFFQMIFISDVSTLILSIFLLFWHIHVRLEEILRVCQEKKLKVNSFEGSFQYTKTSYLHKSLMAWCLVRLLICTEDPKDLYVCWS